MPQSTDFRRRLTDAAYMINASITYIETGMEIGHQVMTTRQTLEIRLAFTVAFIFVAASVARSACASGIHFDNSNAMSTRNMLDFGKQRSERPAVLNHSLLFGNADSQSNVCQILCCYRACANPERFSYDFVCDIPKQPFNRSMFFLGQPLQQSTLIATPVVPYLERTALLESTLAKLLDGAARKDLACACCGNAVYTGIVGQNFGSIRIRHFLFSDKAQIPFASALDKSSGLSESPTSIKVLSLVITESETDSHPATRSRERSKLSCKIEGECASIEANACGIFPVMCLLWLRLSFVSLGYDSTGRTNEIRRQTRSFTHSLIGKVMESYRINYACIESNLRGFIESLRISRLRRFKCGYVFIPDGELHLDCSSCFHVGSSIAVHD